MPDSLFGEVNPAEFSIGQYEGEVFVTHLKCGQYDSQSTNSLQDALSMAERLASVCPLR
jgi:hypothetical protein